MVLTNKLAVGLTAAILTIATCAAVQVGIAPPKPVQAPLDRTISQTLNEDGSMQIVTTPDSYVPPETSDPSIAPVTNEPTDPAAGPSAQAAPAPDYAPYQDPASAKPVSTTEVPMQWSN